jgi:hypothetical protein
MVTKDKIKNILKEYTEVHKKPINEVDTEYEKAVKRELQARTDREKDIQYIETGSLQLDPEHISLDDVERSIVTDPSKGVVSPSHKVVSNICKREQICNEQGKITFGQLEGLIKASHKKKVGLNIGEGIYKSIIRLLPWFVPQIALGAFLGSSMRAVNKVIKPAVEGTSNYKTWWGKAVLNVMKLAEGELSINDPLSKIFFISDGLLEMLGDKYKHKFARYISEIAASKSPSEEVPEFFVENELRNYLNQKFLLDPPLGTKN